MTQLFTGTGLGLQGSSLNQLGAFGLKGSAGLGQGGASVYVNAANGNVVIKQADGFLADFGVGLDLFQTYNSIDRADWRFNTDSRLECDGVVNTIGAVVVRYDEDGHQTRFMFDAEHHQYKASNGSTARLTFDGTAWHYTEGVASRVFDYDKTGRLIMMHDRDGNALRFSYENGQLVCVEDDRLHQSVKWTLNQGVVTDVTFKSDEQVIHQLHYDYDAQHRLTRVSRDMGDGKVYWIAYDYVSDSTLLSDIRQSDGTALHLDYDAQRRVTRMIDGAGRETSYVYEADRTIVTNGQQERWTYYIDEEARLTGVDGPEGFRARYVYEGHYLSSMTQGTQRWSFRYNDAGDCIRLEGPAGDITLRTYDDEHRLINETSYQTVDATQPHTSRWLYDEHGHLRFEINAEGTVIEYRYDAEGNNINRRCYLKEQWIGDACTIDALIKWTQHQILNDISLIDYQYDSRGALTQEIHYTSVNIEGNGILTADALRAYYRYDAVGRCIEKSTITTTGLSSTQYQYDALGRLIQTIDNQGHIASITYDDQHQRILKTDASGLQTLSLYDKSGLLLSTQQLTTQQDYGTVYYQYDEAGRLIAETTVDGKTRNLFYDKQGRLQAMVAANGQVTSYQYNLDGDCVLTRQYQQPISSDLMKKTLDFSALQRSSSEKDKVTQVIYNAYHQIAYQVDADGAVIGFRYDAQGHLITKTAYANRLTAINLDEPLQIAAIVLQPSTRDRVLHYYYDALGRLQAEVNGEGSATAYRYDKEGHVLEVIQYANKVADTRTGDWQKDAPSLRNDADSVRYSIYNFAGLKIADIDAAGYLTEYVYDARGLLTSMIAYDNPIVGRITGEGVSALNAIRPKTHANDHSCQIQYDDLGQKIEERSSTGLITRYTYQADGLLSSETKLDERTQVARQTCHRYDAMGRIIQTLDAGGAQLLQTASPDNIAAIWERHSIRYTYDLAGRLLTETDALNQTTRYFYDDAGLLVYQLNANGAVTETQYDAFQRVSTQIRFSAYCLIAPESLTTQTLKAYMDAHHEGRFDEVTHYEYNRLGQVIRMQKSEGSVIATMYNAFGELEQTIQGDGTTEYAYDRRGLLLERIDDSQGLRQKTQFQYDAWGRATKVLDPHGLDKKYYYNKRGEVTLLIEPDSRLTTYTYDAFGRVIASMGKTTVQYLYDDVKQTLTVSEKNRNATVMTQFNAFGDKLSITDANHHTTQYHYDANGRVSHIESPEQSSIEYTYDAAGHLAFQDNSGIHAVRYTYDAAGHVLTKITDPDGLNLVSRYAYDGIGRQLEVIESGKCTRMHYDNRGNVVQIQVDPDGLNVTTTRVYDDQNRLIRDINHNPEGLDKVTAYTWDVMGRCIAKTLDPDGLALTTAYTYDAQDNLICQTDPNHHKTHFSYNASKSLRYQIDARGVVTEYRYDVQGNRVRTITYAQPIDVTVSDDASVLIQLIKPEKNADHVQYYAYDALNRLQFAYDGLGYATQYTYDANDNLIKKTLFATPCDVTTLDRTGMMTPKLSADDRTTYIAYDALNRARFHLDAHGRVNESIYDATGQLIKERHYAHLISLQSSDYTVNGIQAALISDETLDEQIQYAYDKAGRLTHQVNASGALTSWQYDTAGNPIETRQYAVLLTTAQRQVEDWFRDLSTSLDDRVSLSIYDALNREIYRISPMGRTVERRYDAVGNIIQEIKHGTTQSHVTHFNYDAVARLLQKQEGEQSTLYAYDANGNVTRKTEANQATWTYRYDAKNQLIETVSPMAAIKTYKQGQWIDERQSIVSQRRYDSFGNMVSEIRDVGGLNQTVHYVYDANNRKIKAIYPDVMVNAASTAASNQRQEIAQTLNEAWIYNAFGEVIQSRDRNGHARYAVYNNEGLLTHAIDAEGGLIEYTYDVFGLVQQKTSYAERLLMRGMKAFDQPTISDAKRFSQYDRHEQYRYDKAHRLIETQKDRVNAYDAVTQTYIYAKPVTQLTYNAFGEVVSTAIQCQRDNWDVTKTTYDRDGLKIQTLDAAGYITTYAYDEFGQLAEEIQYAERAVNGEPKASSADRRMSFTYNVLGQLTQKTFKQVTFQRLTGNSGRYENVTADLTNTYAYDAMGHLVATTDAAGHTAYTYYDVLGHTTAKTGPLLSNGRALTTYYYDALGNVLESRQWSNGVQEASLSGFTPQSYSPADIINQYRYDGDGHVLLQIDGTGHQVNFSYDANGNIARRWQTLVQADKTSIIQDKRFTYDDNNQLLETATIKTDGTRATENALYNTFGECTQKGVNGVYTTHMDYDLIGRVWRSNTQGYYQIYVYDLAERVTQVVTLSNTVDHINHKTMPDLSDMLYETASSYHFDVWAYTLYRHDTVYDALGYVIKQTKSPRQSISTEQQVFPPITETQTVDRWGNVLSHTSARGFTTQYHYNAQNNLIEQRLPEVNVVDEQGIARRLNPVIRYAYDALGRSIAMTDANGHTASKILDAEGHVIQEIDALGFHRDKTYNLFGQMTSNKNERGVMTAYTYDAANRLLSVVVGDKTQAYAYDGEGQIIQQSDTAGTNTAYFYDALGHQIKQQGAQGVTQYRYDDAGHKLVEQDANGHTMQWQYDTEGHLTSHTDMGGRRTDYVYNRNGLLLGETSTSGKKIQYFYYNDGQIQTYYDANLNEVLSYEYDAEGNMLSKNGAHRTDWTFENDFYDYDELGRLSSVKRGDLAKTNDKPSAADALLSIDYDYDAVGNIRDVLVAARYHDRPQVHRMDYFRYDANNRMLINKGVLQNGAISINASQGSQLGYDESGNINRALQYEAGGWQQYVYRYTADNQVDRILKNGLDYQSKVYQGGLLRSEMLFDVQGHGTQLNRMRYEWGRLKAIETYDNSGALASNTSYAYDAVGNLTELQSVLSSGVVQLHQYQYETWDTYQQKIDHLVVSKPKHHTKYGGSEWVYGINGQLEKVIDYDLGRATNSLTYFLNSSIDGIRARQNSMGQTSYLTVAGKTIGDLKIDSFGRQALEVYGGFMPAGNKDKAMQSIQSYHNDGSSSSEGETALPISPEHNLGVYTLQAGDTLENVALQVYGDSSLWYLIADANGITDRFAHAGERGSQLHAGQRLTIPHSAQGQHYTSQTRHLASAQEIMGECGSGGGLNAKPSHRKRHAVWKKLGAVVSVVAAAIATVLSAGALGALAGIASPGLAGLISTGLSVLGGASSLSLSTGMGFGLAAGFLGNVTGQGIAAAFKLQKGIDLKSALMSGVATAATAGVGKLLSSSSTYAQIREKMDALSPDLFNLTNASDMMERDALSQGLNMAFAHQQHFDWQELGVSAATAGVLGSKPIQGANQFMHDKFGATGRFVTSEVEALATNGATAVTTNSHFNAAQVLMDNIGNGLSTSMMDSAMMYSMSTEPEEAYCPIPDDAYERFYQEAAMQELQNESSNSPWNTLGDDLIHYGSKLFESWSGQSTSIDTQQLSATLGVAGEIAYGDGYFAEGKGALKSEHRVYKEKDLSEISSNMKYILDLYPSAYAMSQKTGLSLELMLAQGAQETGWGSSVLPGTNNMFNIKKGNDWSGSTYTLKGALEYNKNGSKYYERSEFRVYSSIEESVKDRLDFLLKNKRYAKLFENNIKGNLEKEAFVLQKAHYAGNNRNYAESLIKVANGPTMKKSLEYARKYYGY